VKEFWKSVNIWGSYGQQLSVLFLTHGVCSYSLESKVCYLKEFNRSSKSCEYEIVESWKENANNAQRKRGDVFVLSHRGQLRYFRSVLLCTARLPTEQQVNCMADIK